MSNNQEAADFREYYRPPRRPEPVCDKAESLAWIRRIRRELRSRISEKVDMGCQEDAATLSANASDQVEDFPPDRETCGQSPIDLRESTVQTSPILAAGGTPGGDTR